MFDSSLLYTICQMIDHGGDLLIIFCVYVIDWVIIIKGVKHIYICYVKASFTCILLMQFFIVVRLLLCGVGIA